MKKIILRDEKDKERKILLLVRRATCDFCKEQTKRCFNNNEGIDICWDCIVQLKDFGKR